MLVALQPVPITQSITATINILCRYFVCLPPQAYVGFTASTGLKWEKHDILSWAFCDKPHLEAAATAAAAGSHEGGCSVSHRRDALDASAKFNYAQKRCWVND
jgi:hypothetical protein